MAAASPTPLSSFDNGARLMRRPSHRAMQRRESPISILGQSQGFAADAPMVQKLDLGDSSDDDIPQPIKFSAYTKALLGENKHDNAMSPERQNRAGQPKLRISRNSSASNTPAKDTITPAASLRIKRVPLRGAPMRRVRRTPQDDEDAGHHPSQEASQDQENLQASIRRADSVKSKQDSVMKVDSLQRPQRRPSVQREDKPVALAQISVNTPHRPPPPPPPPKMSVLETATAAAGASTTKTKKKRSHITVNGKVYSQMGKIGKGGSSDVYRVMAENMKMFALKRVKLEDADESAVRGYKGEIDLLRKLEGVERVVRLFDWELDDERQILSVLMDIGESDLSRILRMKLDSESARLDLSFTRYYWKEMLECVQSVHDYDIVHSDLKPANFLLVQGRLKLIDFGIANAIDIENTINVHRDSHVGTPNYMSPESLEDTNASSRGPTGPGGLGKVMKLGKPSDVWSLGCILYQMVYGRPPFAHIPNQIHRVMAIINPNVEISFPPHGVGGVRVPPGLKLTLKHCLIRDASKRPTIPQLLSEKDPFLFPDGGEDLKIPQELLGQIIQRVADRFRDGRKGPPTDEEIRQYPASFYAKIRDLMEEG